MAGAVQDRKTLARIARRLFALALLADRAAGRCFPVRFVVLVLLYRAEVVVSAFVAGLIDTGAGTGPGAGTGIGPRVETETGGPAGPSAAPPARHSFGAADAALLALRLRLLAAMLGMLAGGARAAGAAGASGGRFAPRPPSAGKTPPLPVLLLVRLPARRARRPCDTS